MEVSDSLDKLNLFCDGVFGILQHHSEEYFAITFDRWGTERSARVAFFKYGNILNTNPTGITVQWRFMDPSVIIDDDITQTIATYDPCVSWVAIIMIGISNYTFVRHRVMFPSPPSTLPFMQQLTGSLCTSSTNAPLYSCGMCGVTSGNLRSCKRCRAVKYCSTSCQTRDWGKHREFCKAFKDVKRHVKTSFKKK